MKNVSLNLWMNQILDLKQIKFFFFLLGVMFSVFLIPIRLLENVADADLGALLGSSDEAKAFRKILFSSPGYQKRMSYLLEYFDRKGLLEV